MGCFHKGDRGPENVSAQMWNEGSLPKQTTQTMTGDGHSEYSRAWLGWFHEEPYLDRCAESDSALA
jgi:hypothetical protein